MEAALNRIFPKSFAYKILFVAFLGTHIPLLAFTIYVLNFELGSMDGGASRPWNIFFLILSATLAGTLITLYAINKLLSPIFTIIRNIKAFDRNEPVAHMPETRSDEIGFLIRNVNKWLASTTVKLETFQDEAERDALTGILNRRGFMRRMNSFSTGFMLHFDIDNFKSINDTYGHDKGDLVLIGLVERINGTMRERDIFARLGGEEFVIMVPGGFEAAVTTAERLLDRIRLEPISDLPITVSMGIAEYTLDLDKTMKRADEATYKAKQAGKDTYVVYEASREQT